MEYDWRKKSKKKSPKSANHHNYPWQSPDAGKLHPNDAQEEDAEDNILVVLQ